MVVYSTICEWAQKNESEVADELSEKIALKFTQLKVQFLSISNHYIFGSNQDN